MPLDIFQAAEHLSISVSGYLYGTRRGAEFCQVCTTPVDSSYAYCLACNGNSRAASLNSTQLADLVVPLVYIDDEPQSKLLMHGYKGDQVGPEPQKELLLNVALMSALGLLIHRTCIENAGSPLTALSFVPSTHGRPNHPIRGIANFAGIHSGLPVVEAKYVGPLPSSRGYNPAHYQILPNSVDCRHVLLIDDTWTSGGSAQSVASQFKLTGSISVTILVVGRWLRKGWSASASFMESQMKQNPYSPYDCPVSGTGTCSASLSSSRPSR